MDADWTYDADKRMDDLERDPSMRTVVAAIWRTVDLIEAGPLDNHVRKLSVNFQTEGWRHVRATSTRHARWHVLWAPTYDGDPPAAVAGIIIATVQLP